MAHRPASPQFGFAPGRTVFRFRISRSRSGVGWRCLPTGRSMCAGLDGGKPRVPYCGRLAIGCDVPPRARLADKHHDMRSKLPRLTARLCAVALLLWPGIPPARAAKPTAAAKPVPSWQAVLVAADNAQPVFDNGVEAIAHQLAARG